jgi:hypothetical protein
MVTFLKKCNKEDKTFKDAPGHHGWVFPKVGMQLGHKLAGLSHL